MCVPVAMEEESTDLPGTDGLAPKQRHQAKHRELFLSRNVETLPATHIRGKCSVTLLNETESLLSYLNKDVSMYQKRGDPHHITVLYSLQTKRTNKSKLYRSRSGCSTQESVAFVRSHWSVLAVRTYTTLLLVYCSRR